MKDGLPSRDMWTPLPPAPLLSAPLPASGEDDAGEVGAGEDGAGEDGAAEVDAGEGCAGDDGAGALLLGLGSCLGSCLPAGSAFAERAVNQLFVAAIACRTAWRPLSNLPFPDPVPFSRSPLSRASRVAGVPEDSDEELFGLPIASAGNGTGGWSCEAPSASASALSAFPAAPRPLSELVRDGDIALLSTTASAVSPSGSASWPGGATIRGGSVARPASSTPSSLCPLVPLCTFSRDYPTGDKLLLLSAALALDPEDFLRVM